MSKPIIFISYSRKDERWKELIVNQLNVLELQGTFKVWTDADIGAGEDWYQQMKDALEKATVAILLVSANSLTSDFILREEVAHLMERREKDGLRIFPIIVRDCPWEKVPWLARMQLRPRNGRGLNNKKGAQLENALKEIVLEIDRVVQSASSAKKD